MSFHIIIDINIFFCLMSTFDGDGDAYINDFAAYIPDQIDLIIGEAEGFPGIRIQISRTG